MAPGKSSCGTCNLNNSPKRCFSSSPFPLNHPAAARQTTRGAPAAAELGEMKVGLILPTHARQPGWARSKHGTAGSAKVASVSDSSAFCYHGVTGLGWQRGPRQHRGMAPKAAEGVSARHDTPLLVQTARFPRKTWCGQPGLAAPRWAKPPPASPKHAACCHLRRLPSTALVFYVPSPFSVSVARKGDKPQLSITSNHAVLPRQSVVLHRCPTHGRKEPVAAPRSPLGHKQLRRSAADAREMLAATAPKGRSSVRWCR